MLKLMHNDTVVKEYEDATVFIILNKDKAELIGKKESAEDSEQIANLHVALAFHWALANAPKLIAELIDAFDNQVTEEIEPAIDTIQ